MHIRPYNSSKTYRQFDILVTVRIQRTHAYQSHSKSVVQMHSSQLCSSKSHFLLKT